MITIDSSFYLNQSYLILTYFIIVIGSIILVEVGFIIIVALDYYCAYQAELYATLSIFELLIVMIPKKLYRK